MTRKLDFNEVAAMQFADEATRVAATARFSGEGHPDVADGEATRTLFYSYVNRGRQHSRLVVLAKSPVTGSFKLVSETTVTPPGGVLVKKTSSPRAKKDPSKASQLPSGCKSIVAPQKDTAERRLRSGRRVSMALEVGAEVKINGEDVIVTSINTFCEAKGLINDMKVTSWGVSLSNGLYFEITNPQTPSKRD